MTRQFVKPDGVIGRFGVVKLWPKVKAAEDENIARLKLTAKSLGLECVEITPDGRLLESPHTRQTQADLDFVIHLHFETPKAYDVFSFVALWNPLQFYFDWGYRRFSPHLLTHDDFISCSSTWTDDHVRRLVAHDPTRLPAELTMYHSLSEPILEPTLGEKVIFYAGINWERLGKKKGRHQELLDRIDRAGNLRIYGPKIFQGVNVWEGYASYVGPIPFDGVTAVREISKCGIGLVLSSDAHKQSELMSNRLFESLAAGAVVIADENPFARKFFGDTLLYIDASLPTGEAFDQITAHINWIKAHPAEALELARKSQRIFVEQFALDISLSNIYLRLHSRQQQLQQLYAPADENLPVDLLLLMPEYDPAVLDRHLQSVRTQRHKGIRPVLVADAHDLTKFETDIADHLQRSGLRISTRAVAVFDRGADGRIIRRRRMGQVLQELIDGLPAESLFCLVAPDEELFAEHVQSLAGALTRSDGAQMAFSDIVYQHQNDGTTYHDVQHRLELTEYQINRPLGFARFLFRRSALDATLNSALPYVDFKAVALLASALEHRTPSTRASMIADIQSSFNLGLKPNEIFEREVMRDYCPALKLWGNSIDAAVRDQLEQLEPSSLSLKRLSDMNRTEIAVDLAHSVPVPGFIRRLMFWAYRAWLHRGK